MRRATADEKMTGVVKKEEDIVDGFLGLYIRAEINSGNIK